MSRSGRKRILRACLSILTGLGASTIPARAGDGPGRVVGRPGFDLSYHLGYGYGGKGLGVGPVGGYPFYGGPGYLHAEPPLRRFGRIEPFSYYGGPCYPRVGTSQYYDATGPLVARPPVLQLMDGQDPALQVRGYGAFSGTLPIPETVFAPYASPR